MAADGHIIIDTKINEDGFEAGSKDIEAAARRMAASVGDIGKKAQISLEKQLNAFSKQNAAYAAQEQKVDSLRAKVEELGNQKIETEEFVDLKKQLNDLTQKYMEAYQKQRELIGMGFPIDSAGVAQYTKEMSNLAAEMDEIEQKQLSLKDSGEAYIDPTSTNEYTNALSRLNAEETKLNLSNDSLKTSYSALEEKTAELSAETEKASTKTINFGSALKKLVKYSLGIRSMYVLFRKLRSAIADGFKNLVQYSSETNSAISSVKSSLTQLKNSTAAAFAPLVNAVAPVISKFVNMISAAFTQLGKLIAALTGSNTFTKAVAVQEDYAASLKKTATNTKKAEKAAKSYLSPLDEINRYEEEASDVGDVSGGGYTAPDPSKMFETVEIDSKTKKLAENIKSYLQPIIDAFIRLKEPAMHLFTAIGNTALWLWNTILQPLADWFIQTVVPRLIDIFGKLMDIVAVVIDFINTTILPILEPVINAVLDMVIGAGNGILDVLDGVITFLHGIFTQNWSEAWDGIKMILSGFSVAAVSILNGVQNVFAWFDEWIQKIFVVDWTKAFGVLGVPLNALFSTIKNIWNAIKDVFNGVITFLKGVFTGNWKMAWEGVSQIFKGIWDGLVEIIKIPINAIILLINSFINFIGMGWNTVARSLNKLKVPDWVPVIGGKGISLPEIPTSPIPYLAKGAVIPPNAPFTAVLGDQKRGTNIETPENLLRQIMREELGRSSGGSGGSYTFIGQINRRTLFEEVINEATIRQTVTGKNPFELA